jgi:hypothetical protein
MREIRQDFSQDLSCFSNDSGDAIWAIRFANFRTRLCPSRSCMGVDFDTEEMPWQAEGAMVARGWRVLGVLQMKSLLR